MVLKSFQMPIGNGHWESNFFNGYFSPIVVEKSVLNCVNAKNHWPSSLKASLSLNCSICIYFINNSFGGEILGNKLNFKYNSLVAILKSNLNAI